MTDTREGAGLDILLIEDSDPLCQNIVDYLEPLGHRLHLASDGRAGLEMALGHPFDLIILDIGLPRIDGLALCQKLRESADRHVPVLMLTARDTLDDKLAGFAAGADDYLTKPFALAELAARIGSLSLRHRVGKDHLLQIGPLQMDRKRRAAHRDGKPLKLTPVAWKILLTLAEAYPQPIARFELTRRLWGDEPPDSDALRSHIHLLRQVLDKPFPTPMLETVHGVGFRLRTEE